MPRTWLTVITPVPPMPERRTVKASVGTSGTVVVDSVVGVGTVSVVASSYFFDRLVRDRWGERARWATL